MLADVRHQDESVLFLRGVIEGRVTSPLLLLGQEGTGRRYAALQTIQELFCSGTREASCPCVDCLWVQQALHPDLTVLYPQDGKDIGVDAIRNLLDVAQTYPSQARFRAFLIDGADRLTPPAANALLKTLEEPPSTARFFLLAESAAQVLPTIRSRCGVLNFRPLPESFLLAGLQKFESDPTKALVLARLSEGSIGRAIQYWGSGRLALRDKALSLLTAAQARDVAGVFLTVEQLEKELPLLLRFLNTLLHDLLILGVSPNHLINADKATELQKLRAPSSGWHSLQTSLRGLLDTQTRIQLPFHVKAILLEAFGV